MGIVQSAYFEWLFLKDVFNWYTIEYRGVSGDANGYINITLRGSSHKISTFNKEISPLW